MPSVYETVSFQQLKCKRAKCPLATRHLVIATLLRDEDTILMSGQGSGGLGQQYQYDGHQDHKHWLNGV